jgi:[NiFe] hydrogenase diaphorase moiety small subunit
VNAPIFTLDRVEIPFAPGQSILQAARAAGRYIPHLCFHPELKAHGSCRVCMVRVAGRLLPACATPAQPGMVVESEVPEVQQMRRALVEMLFVEGNHFCPSCEKSGDCQLQATAYHLGMLAPQFDYFYPERAVDASHPEFLLDFNRCILCSLCVRASRDVDGKNVFGLSGRGLRTRLTVNAASGRLGDTEFAAGDFAARVCPVGAILKKRQGFQVPIGERTYDRHSIAEIDQHAPPQLPREHGLVPEGPMGEAPTSQAPRREGS